MINKRTTFVILIALCLTVACVHKPPAFTTPHVPTVTTDQKPGAVTR